MPLKGGGPSDAGSTAFRILYRSTSPSGEPIAVSGAIFIPSGPAPAGGRDVIMSVAIKWLRVVVESRTSGARVNSDTQSMAVARLRYCRRHKVATISGVGNKAAVLIVMPVV